MGLSYQFLALTPRLFGLSLLWVKNFLPIYAVSKFRGAFRNVSNIEDGAFCKDNSRLKAVHYFRKKLRFRCLTGFEYTERVPMYDIM